MRSFNIGFFARQILDKFNTETFDKFVVSRRQKKFVNLSLEIKLLQVVPALNLRPTIERAAEVGKLLDDIVRDALK